MPGGLHKGSPALVHFNVIIIIIIIIIVTSIIIIFIITIIISLIGLNSVYIYVFI